MRSKLCALLATCISIFGLTSCTSDKASNIDSWSLPNPLLVVQKSEEEAPITTPFISSTLEVTSVAATIQFPEHGEQTMKDVELHIQSDCRTDNESASLEAHFKNVSLIPLRSLVPEQYWRRLDPPESEVLVCNFIFEGKNLQGSTHRFAANGIKIGLWKDLEISATTTMALEAARLPESFPILQLAKPSERQGAFSPDQEWQIDLICDRFRNSRVVGSQRFGQALLTELAEGPFHTRYFQPSSTLQDSRKTHLLQRCRLIAITHDKISNVRFFRTTSTFKLQFPTPKLETVFTTGFKIPIWTNYKTDWTFQLSVRNTTSNVIALAVPKRGPQRVWLQAVVTQHGQFYFQKEFQEEFDLLLRGGRLVSSEGMTEIVELGPNETLHFEQRVSKERSDTVCDLGTYAWAYAKPNDPITGSYPKGVGLRAGLEEDFVVRQLYNWDPTTRDTSSSKFEVFTLAWAKKPSELILPGWIPQDSWIEHTGDGKMPEPVTAAVPVVGDCGTMRTIMQPK